ncbi:MAG TPA: tetratricopeptide repeat protein [Dongiaceae bacterium]|jgi:predicted Zn-dependent protease
MSKHFSIAVLTLALLVTGLPSAYAVDTEETPASASSADFGDAKAMVDAGRFDEALSALRTLDKQMPNNPDVLNLIGFSLRKTGNTDRALDYYNRALALKPDHLGANEYLGELYLELKQPEKAEERLAVLQKACGNCEEYQDLKSKIEQAQD